MHGPSFAGDGAAALHGLAGDYDRRVRAALTDAAIEAFANGGVALVGSFPGKELANKEERHGKPPPLNQPPRSTRRASWLQARSRAADRWRAPDANESNDHEDDHRHSRALRVGAKRPVRARGRGADALAVTAQAVPQSAASDAPESLQDTGLYSDFAALQVDEKHLAFSPQYPLWTDGASKRRWISLPAGSAIDASDPDAWAFPVGTRLWKEFSFAGQRVETRYMERRPDGRGFMPPMRGARTARGAARLGQRPAWRLSAGEGRSHTIPGVSDSKVCHQGGRTEVLGFSAVQLSPQRDPGALHAVLCPRREQTLAP
jgi:hypothetical protein